MNVLSVQWQWTAEVRIILGRNSAICKRSSPLKCSSMANSFLSKYIFEHSTGFCSSLQCFTWEMIHTHSIMSATSQCAWHYEYTYTSSVNTYTHILLFTTQSVSTTNVTFQVIEVKIQLQFGMVYCLSVKRYILWRELIKSFISESWCKINHLLYIFWCRIQDLLSTSFLIAVYICTRHMYKSLHTQSYSSHTQT